MYWKQWNNEDIDKIGGNICGDRILYRVDETPVSDTPAEEEKFKIGEEKRNHKGKVLLKDSDNGREIVPQRKKDIFKKIVSWMTWKKKGKQNLRLVENIREAVSKLEENVRKGKERK